MKVVVCKFSNCCLFDYDLKVFYLNLIKVTFVMAYQEYFLPKKLTCEAAARTRLMLSTVPSTKKLNISLSWACRRSLMILVCSSLMRLVIWRSVLLRNSLVSL